MYNQNNKLWVSHTHTVNLLCPPCWLVAGVGVVSLDASGSQDPSRETGLGKSGVLIPKCPSKVISSQTAFPALW